MKTQEQYIADAGNLCPVCSSDQIQGRSIEIDGREASQRIDCADCNSSWVDYYNLVGFRVVYEGTPNTKTSSRDN